MRGGGNRGGGAQDIAIVWKRQADKSLEPVQVRIGITDHTVTEIKDILKGSLKEGDELIVGSSSGSGGQGGAARPPGMGGAPGGFGGAGGGGRRPGG